VRLASLTIALALSMPACSHAEDLYTATFTGTFTTVDFDGIAPGRFANLGTSDTYSLTIATHTTGHTSGSATIYDIVSMTLTIDDGVAPIDVAPGVPGYLSINAVQNDSYTIFLSSAVLDDPFEDSVRLSLADLDGDPVRETEDLPLSLDLSEFSDRAFFLFGSIGEPFATHFPRAYATVDTFAAHIIPAPGTLAMLGLGLAARRARR